MHGTNGLSCPFLEKLSVAPRVAISFESIIVATTEKSYI